MSRKSTVHLSLQDNCICWNITTPTGGSQFALGLELGTDGTRRLKNFLWEMEEEKTKDLATFLKAIADKSFLQALKARTERKTQHQPRRMRVEAIKIKPDMEERFHHILSQLQPDTTGGPKIQTLLP